MKNSSKPTNVHNAIIWGTETLKSHDIFTPRLDCLVLLGYVCKVKKAWLLANPDHALSDSQQTAFTSIITERSKNIPVAYLLGEKEFFGREFVVNKDVLVPRPETEDMVELALKLPQNQALKIIDIGTGSGAIAVTLAIERPNWRINASDVSRAALNISQKNAKRYKVYERIDFLNQDLLKTDDSKYDVVLANLPYVPINLTDKPDIAHEPPIALFAGADGLDAYRNLFDQLSQRKFKPKHILTESLTDQHLQVSKLASASDYQLVQTLGLIQHFEHSE